MGTALIITDSLIEISLCQPFVSQAALALRYNKGKLSSYPLSICVVLTLITATPMLFGINMAFIEDYYYDVALIIFIVFMPYGVGRYWKIFASAAEDLNPHKQKTDPSD